MQKTRSVVSRVSTIFARVMIGAASGYLVALVVVSSILTVFGPERLLDDNFARSLALFSAMSFLAAGIFGYRFLWIDTKQFQFAHAIKNQRRRDD